MIEMIDNPVDCPKLNGLTSWTISFWLKYKDINPLKTLMTLYDNLRYSLKINQDYIDIHGRVVNYN